MADDVRANINGRKEKNREYRMMRRLYGVTDERTQMAKILLYLPDAIQSISTRLSNKLCLPLWMCGVRIGFLHEAGKSG